MNLGYDLRLRLSCVVSTSLWELQDPKRRTWGVTRFLLWPQKFGECDPAKGDEVRGEEGGETEDSGSAGGGEALTSLHASSRWCSIYSRKYQELRS